jgi:signal transduction histidine kinase
MPLRAYLISLTLATLLPVAIFAGIVVYFLRAEQRETFRQGAEARTLAVSTAVDAALHGSIATLEALATLPALEEGDVATLRDRAERILATQPDWSNINLALPSGQQIMNLQRPAGAPLPNVARLDPLWQRVVDARQPFVSDLVVGPITGRWDYAVRVPVIRDGSVKFVLSAVVKPESMSRLLEAQSVPPDWVAVVIDRNDRIVARTVNPEASVGQLASQSLRDALARSPTGWFHGSTIEGTAVYTPYRRSDSTGWAFAMGIPAYAVDAAGTYAAWMLVVGLLGAIGVAVAASYLLGRRVATPIASLAAATGAIGRGEALRLATEPVITEVKTLANALEESARAVRERQELLEREKQALQAADRAKDEFLATLSHELRNPLAALTAAAHVLKVTDPSREAAIKARAVIERQTRHMARLIGDLLDIGRVSAGKVGLERERLDLGEVVGNVLRTWRGSGRFERHRVSHELAPVWVDADRTRLEQIVANLLDNSLKFTPTGKAIRLSVRAEGDAAVLCVEDEGAGIPPADSQRVFDVFVQGSHRQGGMGIGLALVKRLAELHGGTVQVVSEGADRGAAFTVRLPAVSAPPAQPASAPPRRPGGLSVLLVEDNDDAREMLKATLASGGHEVRVARDGASGIALAAASPPDVALIDIGLPDMDGYEVARRLRAARGGRRLGLVAITGFGRPEDQQRAFDAGFDAHLTKPVTPDRLKQALAGLP